MAGSKDRYLFRRGGTWYFRRRYRGKEVVKSLHTSSVERARLKRNDLVAEMERVGWDAFMQKITDAVRAVEPGTVGEVIEAYRSAAHARDLRPKTVGSNVGALRSILKAAGYHEPDKEPLTVLNQKALVAYRDAQENTRTVGSTIRQARSLFARWALSQAYEGIVLPDLTEFLQASVVRVQPKVYQRPPDALVKATKAAGQKLADENPDLYVVWLLCYELGMRASEAIAATWEWVGDPDQQGIRRVAIIGRDDFRPKGRDHWVPIPEETYADLEAHCSKRLHLLPGATLTDRENLVRRDFAAWMRGIGWNRETYPKAAHELRKLRGSDWFTKVSPQAAQSWLGHTSIETTCRYYAALSEEPMPLGRELK